MKNESYSFEKKEQSKKPSIMRRVLGGLGIAGVGVASFLGLDRLDGGVPGQEVSLTPEQNQSIAVANTELLKNLDNVVAALEQNPDTKKYTSENKATLTHGDKSDGLSEELHVQLDTANQEIDIELTAANAHDDKLMSHSTVDVSYRLPEGTPASATDYKSILRSLAAQNALPQKFGTTSSALGNTSTFTTYTVHNTANGIAITSNGVSPGIAGEAAVANNAVESLTDSASIARSVSNQLQ